MSTTVGLREALPGLDALLVLDAESAGRIIASRPDIWQVLVAHLSSSESGETGDYRDGFVEGSRFQRAYEAAAPDRADQRVEVPFAVPHGTTVDLQTAVQTGLLATPDRADHTDALLDIERWSKSLGPTMDNNDEDAGRGTLGRIHRRAREALDATPDRADRHTPTRSGDMVPDPEGEWVRATPERADPEREAYWQAIFESQKATIERLSAAAPDRADLSVRTRVEVLINGYKVLEVTDSEPPEADLACVITAAVKQAMVDGPMCTLDHKHFAAPDRADPLDNPDLGSEYIAGKRGGTAAAPDRADHRPLLRHERVGTVMDATPDRADHPRSYDGHDWNESVALAIPEDDPSSEVDY